MPFVVVCVVFVVLVVWFPDGLGPGGMNTRTEDNPRSTMRIAVMAVLLLRDGIEVPVH